MSSKTPPNCCLFDGKLVPVSEVVAAAGPMPPLTPGPRLIFVWNEEKGRWVFKETRPPRDRDVRAAKVTP